MTFVACVATQAHADEQLGVRVPKGFEVTLFADDDLAHDIHSMTLDSQGRVVVSAPGYVRILLDRDGDGKAEAFQQFVAGPKTGAQGMYFDGPDLLCTGDAGLIRYRDRNGDGRADGPPETLLAIKTGGEHHAHAIQRGPDGWWYLIAGNYAGVTEKYASLPTSPIKKPQGGTLLRLPPDFSGSEVVADGYRNAYDFAFNPQGDVFTYDSDGERGVSLPWYRPTRVFHMLPGSHAGWVSRSWKRPDYFPDMPPVLASLGRGSPTGVVCYDHTQFPPPYRGALFVCDWTFGRVIALPLKRAGEIYKTEPISFMTGVGQFGFAPSDLEVAPDGSLYLAVGGRGTRGGVYRVRYVGPLKEDRKRFRHPLTACLDMPQPLASWSRANWLPLAKRRGRAAFVFVSEDENRSTRQRMRAIEILTELFGGLDESTHKKLAKKTVPAEIRARAAWSAGRIRAEQPDDNNDRVFFGLTYLEADTRRQDPLVARFAWEALIGSRPPTVDSLKDMLDNRLINWILATEPHFSRQAAIRLLPTLAPGEPQTALHSYARAIRENEYYRDAVRHGAGDFLRGGFKELPYKKKLFSIRTIQLGIGDVGPGKHAPVFDGYTSRIDLKKHDVSADGEVDKNAERLFPTGERHIDLELSRLLAMLSTKNEEVLNRVLAKVTENSHPSDDLHYLIVAARMPSKRTAKQREAIAKALVELDQKIERRKLNRDLHWDERIGELVAELVRLDGELPQAVVRQEGFGWPDHVIYLKGLSRKQKERARAAFVDKARQHEGYAWNSDVVYLVGRTPEGEHHGLIRKQYDNYAVRNAVLATLAGRPRAEDRAKFVAGLESTETWVLSACTWALSRLPATRDEAEQIALVRTLRRLGREEKEYPAKEKYPLLEQIVNLLRRNTGQDFGYVLGKAGHRPQAAAIAKWTDWAAKTYPRHRARLLGSSDVDLAKFKQQLAAVDWSGGDAARGRKLFDSRSCSRCHGSRRALGPDLAGVARRFSRDDLFTAIVAPNRDVSPRYQTTMIQTTRGKQYTGLVIYESVDGVTLRDGQNQTFRIEASEIEVQRKVNNSLMPSGLLKDLKPGDLADLYAFLRGLNK